MRKLFCGVLVFGLISIAEADSNIQKFRDNFDGGKETCTSLGGTEIKKYQVYSAGEDRFYQNFKIEKISGHAPKTHGCHIVREQTKKVKLKSGNFDVEVSVPVEYEVFAHADCGSNAANLYKTISIECDITADIVEYK